MMMTMMMMTVPALTGILRATTDAFLGTTSSSSTYWVPLPIVVVLVVVVMVRSSSSTFVNDLKVEISRVL